MHRKWIINPGGYSILAADLARATCLTPVTFDVIVFGNTTEDESLVAPKENVFLASLAVADAADVATPMENVLGGDVLAGTLPLLSFPISACAGALAEKIELFEASSVAAPKIDCACELAAEPKGDGTAFPKIDPEGKVAVFADPSSDPGGDFGVGPLNTIPFLVEDDEPESSETAVTVLVDVVIGAIVVDVAVVPAVEADVVVEVGVVEDDMVSGTVQMLIAQLSEQKCTNEHEFADSAIKVQTWRVKGQISKAAFPPVELDKPSENRLMTSSRKISSDWFMTEQSIRSSAWIISLHNNMGGLSAVCTVQLS